MNRRNLLGVMGASMAATVAMGATDVIAQQQKDQSISDRLHGRRIRVYPESLEAFFLGTVDRVEGSLIYLKDVKVPITEPVRDALVDTRAVRLITILGTDEKEK
jgi:hypothetical protein